MVSASISSRLIVVLQLLALTLLSGSTSPFFFAEATADVAEVGKNDCDDGTFCFNNGVCRLNDENTSDGASDKSFRCECIAGYSGPVCGVKPGFEETPILNSDGSQGSLASHLLKDLSSKSGISKAGLVTILLFTVLALLFLVGLCCWCKFCRHKNTNDEQTQKQISEPTVSMEDKYTSADNQVDSEIL